MEWNKIKQDRIKRSTKKSSQLKSGNMKQHKIKWNSVEEGRYAECPGLQWASGYSRPGRGEWVWQGGGERRQQGGDCRRGSLRRAASLESVGPSAQGGDAGRPLSPLTAPLKPGHHLPS